MNSSKLCLHPPRAVQRHGCKRLSCLSLNPAWEQAIYRRAEGQGPGHIAMSLDYAGSLPIRTRLSTTEFLFQGGFSSMASMIRAIDARASTRSAAAPIRSERLKSPDGDPAPSLQRYEFSHCFSAVISTQGQDLQVF